MDRIYVKKDNMFYLNTYVKPVKEVIYYDIYQTILSETRDRKVDIDQIVIIVNKKDGSREIKKKEVGSVIDIKTAVERYEVIADKIYIDRYVDHSMLYIEIGFDVWIEEKFEEIDRDYILGMGNLVKENEKSEVWINDDPKEEIIEDDSNEIEVWW